ncbi:MAG: type III-A CRISPR-associated RAMP protein Csm5 [Desulfosoma sp.]
MATQTATSPVMDKALEKLTVFLTVLSPIHIGTKDGALQPMEYLFDGARVHVVDETKLGRFLLQRNLLDNFVQQAFSGDLRKKGLHGFLKEKARDVDFRKIGPQVASYSVPGGSSNMPDFRPFVRDGFGNVYLPGTSIKGVLRTAIIYNILKSELPSGSSQGKHPREQKVRSWIRQLRTEKKQERAKKFLSTELQKTTLQCWKLAGGGKEQNRDLLRCLKVRDAYPLNGKVETSVIPIRFLSKKKDGAHYWSAKPRGGGDLEIWVEAVIGGTFQTEILWDHALWEKFCHNNPTLKNLGEMSPKKILLMANAMNRDVIDHERAFYSSKGMAQGELLKQWYEQLGTSVLRIGFGSGMLSTTVNLLWSEQLRREIRNVCGHDRGEDPAPKSRRVWVKSDRECLPMGWTQIRIASDPRDGEAIPKDKDQTASQEPREQRREDQNISQVRTFEKSAPKPSQPVRGDAVSIQARGLSGGNLQEARTSAASKDFSKQGEGVSPKSPEVKVSKTPSSALEVKAKETSLTNRIEMERLLKDLEKADKASARAAAQILKDRMLKQKLWKTSPYKTTLEEILSEDDL